MDSKNLTCLRSSVRKSDDEAFLAEVTSDLRLVNDLAKPGGGYELTIGKGDGIGYIEYAHYDSMGEAAVKMWFNTYTGKIILEVGGMTPVEVRKVTNL